MLYLKSIFSRDIRIYIYGGVYKTYICECIQFHTYVYTDLYANWHIISPTADLWARQSRRNGCLEKNNNMKNTIWRWKHGKQSCKTREISTNKPILFGVSMPFSTFLISSSSQWGARWPRQLEAVTAAAGRGDDLNDYGPMAMMIEEGGDSWFF